MFGIVNIRKQSTTTKALPGKTRTNKSTLSKFKDGKKRIVKSTSKQESKICPATLLLLHHGITLWVKLNEASEC